MKIPHHNITVTHVKVGSNPNVGIEGAVIVNYRTLTGKLKILRNDHARAFIKQCHERKIPYTINHK